MPALGKNERKDSRHPVPPPEEALRFFCEFTPYLATHGGSADFVCPTNDEREITMTFSCKNFDFNADNCMKLKTDCIPGRPGCVLEGKVRFSEDIEKKLKVLAEQRVERRKKRHRG